MQSSPATETRLGEQLFALLRRLMLNPEADHLRAVDELELTVTQVRAIHMLACSDPEPLPGGRSPSGSASPPPPRAARSTDSSTRGSWLGPSRPRTGAFASSRSPTAAATPPSG